MVGRWSLNFFGSNCLFFRGRAVILRSFREGLKKSKILVGTGILGREGEENPNTARILYPSSQTLIQVSTSRSCRHSHNFSCLAVTAVGTFSVELVFCLYFTTGIYILILRLLWTMILDICFLVGFNQKNKSWYSMYAKKWSYHPCLLQG